MLTTAPTHSDYAALLAACAAAPDEDTPRLALADWLEENDDPAHAELIRVQIDIRNLYVPLAQLENGFNFTRDDSMGADCWLADYKKSLLEELRARESALLAEHEARWRRGPECEWCEDWGGKWGWTKEKGAKHLRRDCPACRGTGWERWWLAERRIVDHPDGPRSTTTWRHRVHFVRGFIVQVDCNLDDVFHADAPTPWALAVVRSEPLLRRFGVVDPPPLIRQSFDWSNNMGKLFWPLDRLPQLLWKWMVKDNPNSSFTVYYDSPAAANRALAEAAWRVVKEKA